MEVFLPKDLVLRAPALALKVSGFWKLSWLRVEGVAMPEAHCF